jgi:hypothetical protein
LCVIFGCDINSRPSTSTLIRFFAKLATNHDRMTAFGCLRSGQAD